MTLVIKGQVLTFEAEGYRHEAKGAVAVGDDGRILWVGPQTLLPQAFRAAPVEDHDDCIVMPGLIDAHIHFPQYRILAAPGKDLLDWLNRFTFPEEARYADPRHAAAAAEVFLDRLVQHGTTSALVFCSVHKVCTDSLFAAAQKRNMAVITGKTLMDRNVPASVRDDAETSARAAEELYRQWHGKGRLRYAVTPRFAASSSEQELKWAGEFLGAYPDALMQTHLSESPGEIEMVLKAFPWAKDYTDVYDRFRLLGPRSLFAHGIHLSARECARLAESRSTVIHCPTSNTFLGSGLMPMAKRPMPLALATDIGGGTSYSMLATMGEAYKVQMLTGHKPTALDLFRMSTRGNAECLHIEAETGSLEHGKWADVTVLDPRATPLLASRHEISESLEDILFALMILGDDRAIRATYVAGKTVKG